MANFQGLQVWGPNGDLWIDTSDLLTRQLGSAVINSANGSLQTLDFSYTSPEKPWYSIISGYCGATSLSFPSSGVARLTFNYGTDTGSGSVIYGTS